jgi:hypothetical protein
MAREKTINYYGSDVDELLRSGRKIVTLRKPNEKYNLPAGTLVDANCTDTSTTVPVTVIANDTRPINEFPNATLLMDGYAIPEIAADDLRRYYDVVKVETPMQRVATLPDSLWISLTEAEQTLLLQSGLDAAIKIPAFRRIFFPSMLFWFSTYGNATVDNWNQWSVAQGLVTQAEVDAKKNVDDDTKRFSTLTLHGRADAALKDPTSAFYRSVVLHEAVSLKR